MGIVQLPDVAISPEERAEDDRRIEDALVDALSEAIIAKLKRGESLKNSDSPVTEDLAILQKIAE